MRRSQITLALAVLAGGACGVLAQPGQSQRPQPPIRIFGTPVQPPPQRTQLQPWWAGIPVPDGKGGRGSLGNRPRIVLRGVEPDAVPDAQGIARWWASKLAADAELVKYEITMAQPPRNLGQPVMQHADQVIALANSVDEAIGKLAQREWSQGYAQLDQSLASLEQAAQQAAQQVPALNGRLSQVRYNQNRLQAALVSLESGGTQEKPGSPNRLLTLLEEHADALHEAVHTTRNIDPKLDQASRAFLRAVIRYDVALELGANPTQAAKYEASLGQTWDGVLSNLGTVSGLNPEMRRQIAHVDALLRGLSNPTRGRPFMPVEQRSVLAVGAEAGLPPRVIVFSDDHGTVAHSFDAYSPRLYKSGVRVATADLNGDGHPELVTVPGGGKLGRVWVFDGRDMLPLLKIDAFGGREADHGYTVATHELTRDGRALVAVATDTGAVPEVEVYDLAAGKRLASFQPFDRRMTGGVRVALADVNGDGVTDLIATQGPTNTTTEVRVFDGKRWNNLLAQYAAVDQRYTGGAWVSASDLSGDGKAEVVIGLDAGARPFVRVLEGMTGKALGQVEPYPNTFRGGVRVATGDPDDAGKTKLIVAPGPGGNNLPIRVIQVDGKVHSELTPFPNVNRGAFVGSR